MFVRIHQHPLPNSTSRQQTYQHYTSWDPDDEAQAFQDWWRDTQHIINSAHDSGSSVRIYVYTQHERTNLTKLVERHQTDGMPTEGDVAELFANDVTDLAKVVKKGLILPTSNRSLKTVATRYANFTWNDDDPSGDSSTAWFREATDPERTTTQHDDARNRLLTYNQDDCTATLAILDHLTIDGTWTTPGSTLPGISELDR